MLPSRMRLPLSSRRTAPRRQRASLPPRPQVGHRKAQAAAETPRFLPHGSAPLPEAVSSAWPRPQMHWRSKQPIQPALHCVCK